MMTFLLVVVVTQVFGEFFAPRFAVLPTNDTNEGTKMYGFDVI